MKHCAILAVTHGGMDETNSKLWNVTGMTDEHTVSHGPWKGQDAADFMAQFDRILLWHWPSPFMCQWARSYDIELVPFIEIDAVKAYPEWSPINERLRTVLTYPLVEGLVISNKPNRFGNHYVDYYETDPAPEGAKPHVWACQTTSTRVRDQYMRELRKVWNMYPPESKPSMIAIDSHNKRYWGTASNKPFENYEHDWDYWDCAIALSCAPVIAHTAGAQPAADRLFATPFVHSEWGLQQSFTDVVKMISNAHHQQWELTLAVNDRFMMAKMNTLESMGATPSYVQTARSGMFGWGDKVDWVGK